MWNRDYLARNLTLQNLALSRNESTIHSSRPCGLKREHTLAIEQLFNRFLSLSFKVSILIVSKVLSHAIYQFHIVRHSGPQCDWEIIDTRQKSGNRAYIAT